MEQRFAPYNIVPDITSHIAKTNPNLIASWIPAIDGGGSTLQNYGCLRGASNYELRAGGTTTWTLREGGRALTVANGVNSRMRTTNNLASTVNDRNSGFTIETYLNTKTTASNSRRLVSLTISNQNLGIWWVHQNFLSFGGVGGTTFCSVFSNTLSMANWQAHVICSTTGGSTSLSYIYVRNLLTNEIVTASGSGTTGLNNNTRGPQAFGIGDLSQTTSQENCDVFYYNYYNTYKDHTWARKRLGESPWAFITAQKRQIGFVSPAGQPFNKRQGGVIHTLNASRPFRQGFW